MQLNGKGKYLQAFGLQWLDNRLRLLATSRGIQYYNKSQFSSLS